MIWHIFKKDVLLLWPFAVALAIAETVSAALTIVLGHFQEPRELAVIASFYPDLVLLGIIVLTIAAVHQEPLSGIRQDWLMRPIARRDLLLAKVLFAILIILAPIFLIDVTEQMFFGISLADSIGAAASRGVGLLCALTVPALLLGAVTASLSQAFIFALVVGIGSVVVYLGVFLFILKPPDLPSGVQWIATVSGAATIAIAISPTVMFAYARRHLLTARILGVLAVLMGLAISGWLPFSAAFAIQQTVSRTVAKPQDIELRFGATAQPAAAPIDPPPGLVAGAGSGAIRAGKYPMAQLQDELLNSSHSAALVSVPLRISGLPWNSILLADQISVRVSGSDGATLYQGVGVCGRLPNVMGRVCRANALVVREKQPEAADIHVEQRLNLPAAEFVKFKDRPVTLQLDFALTSLKPGPTQTMATIGDQRHLPGLGSCATRIDADGDEVEVRCLSTAAPPSCVIAFLDDSKSGLRNPELGGCGPDYVPFAQSASLELVLNRFGLSLPFRDLSGLARYPIDGTKIQSAHISLVAYQPSVHFRRTVVIPNIRLADWQVARSPTDAASALR